MTTLVPHHEAAGLEPSRRFAVLQRTLRIVVGVAVAATAVLGAVLHQDFRTVEAAIAAGFLGAILDGDIGANSTFIHFGLPGEPSKYLNVSLLCSSIVVLLPIGVLAGAFLALTRMAPWRIALAVMVAVLIDLPANAVRVAVIAWAWQLFGEGGYEQMHMVYGSILALLIFSLSFIAFILISTRDSKK